MAKAKSELSKGFPIFGSERGETTFSEVDRAKIGLRNLKIIQKSAQGSNIVFVLPKRSASAVEPGDVFGLYTGEQLKGVNLTDDPVLQLKIFNFPAMKMKLIFEENRIRIEDGSMSEPGEAIAAEALKLLERLFPGISLTAYGFNYDIFYRFDNVLAWRETMSAFLSKDILDETKDFGWQFTLDKDHGKKTERYFLKLISPIEIALHTNHHFLLPPPKDAKNLAQIFKKCWHDTDLIFKHMVI